MVTQSVVVDSLLPNEVQDCQDRGGIMSVAAARRSTDRTRLGSRPRNRSSRMRSVNQVYKITFPNGKIYIGQDVTGTLRYFGSWKVDLVAGDLTPEQLRDLTLRKQ